jgi:hypothetical protein
MSSFITLSPNHSIERFRAWLAPMQGSMRRPQDANETISGETMTISHPIVDLTITAASTVIGCDPQFLVVLSTLGLVTYHSEAWLPIEPAERSVSLEEAAYVAYVFHQQLQAGKTPEQIVAYLMSGPSDDPSGVKYATRIVARHLRAQRDVRLN